MRSDFIERTIQKKAATQSSSMFACVCLKNDQVNKVYNKKIRFSEFRVIDRNGVPSTLYWRGARM